MVNFAMNSSSSLFSVLEGDDDLSEVSHSLSYLMEQSSFRSNMSPKSKLMSSNHDDASVWTEHDSQELQRQLAMANSQISNLKAELTTAHRVQDALEAKTKQLTNEKRVLLSDIHEVIDQYQSLEKDLKMQQKENKELMQKLVILTQERNDAILAATLRNHVSSTAIQSAPIVSSMRQACLKDSRKSTGDISTSRTIYNTRSSRNSTGDIASSRNSSFKGQSGKTATIGTTSKIITEGKTNTGKVSYSNNIKNKSPKQRADAVKVVSANLPSNKQANKDVLNSTLTMLQSLSMDDPAMQYFMSEEIDICKAGESFHSGCTASTAGLSSSCVGSTRSVASKSTTLQSDDSFNKTIEIQALPQDDMAEPEESSKGKTCNSLTQRVRQDTVASRRAQIPATQAGRGLVPLRGRRRRSTPILSETALALDKISITTENKTTVKSTELPNRAKLCVSIPVPVSLCRSTDSSIQTREDIVLDPTVETESDLCSFHAPIDGSSNFSQQSSLQQHLRQGSSSEDVVDLSQSSIASVKGNLRVEWFSLKLPVSERIIPSNVRRSPWGSKVFGQSNRSCESESSFSK